MDRFVKQPIRKPMDVVKIFSGVTPGQQHNLIPALRALLNFAKLKGYSKTWTNTIPESVADFIQGRTPKSVGAKHYMVLVRQAKKYYPIYAEYITQLRQKALN